MEAPRASCESVNTSLPPQTTKPTPVSIANQRYFQWMARISRSLSPARSRNGSCWFAVSDQAEKNRPVKNVLLEKKGDCMRDEYQILVHPVVSGSGKPLFKNIKDRVNLKLVK